MQETRSMQALPLGQIQSNKIKQQTGLTHQLSACY